MSRIIASDGGPVAGFSLIELLVVISIIAVLAGILFPVASSLRESSKRSNCGSNQRMIVMDMLAYAQNNSGRWPRMRFTGSRYEYPFTAAGADDLDNVTVIPAANLGIETVADTFNFLLSDQVAGAVGPKSFWCPAIDKRLQKAVTGTPWAVATSYAFDYGIMPDSGSDRIVLADRPQGIAGNRATNGSSSTHLRRLVMAAADGHVDELMLAPSGVGSGAITSEVYIDGGLIRTAPAANAQVAPNRASGDLNIYDNSGDDVMQSSGSRNRAWLR